MKKYLLSGALVLGMFVAFLLGAFHQAPVSVGSIAEGQDYKATSTAANSVYGGITASRLIKSGSGSFGTVNITGSNTGIVNFYDATTSDVTKRTGNKATTTLLLASFPASTAANNFVFDVGFSNGLLLDLVSGNMPTSTISYR